MTPEIIDQDVAPESMPPMSDKDRKLFAKQEKERLKREKEEEKKRKKEEEKERKRLEKEKKAVLAEEKKAANKKGKQKGKDNKKDSDRDVRERRDSKNSNDIGRDWDHARNIEERGPVTPDRTRKRLSSFEDIKKETEREDSDRAPTPPAPLPVGVRDYDDGSRSGSSEFDSADERDERDNKDALHADDHEPEEVSF